MRNLLILVLFLPIFSFSKSINTFFIIEDTLTLECKDVEQIIKRNDKRALVYYTEEGRKKIHFFTKKYKNKKLGLFADDSLIFMDILIGEPFTSVELPKGYTSSTSFYTNKGNIDKFINTFRHCKNLVKD